MKLKRREKASLIIWLKLLSYLVFSPQAFRGKLLEKKSRYLWVIVCSLGKIVFNLSLFFSFLTQRSVD